MQGSSLARLGTQRSLVGSRGMFLASVGRQALVGRPRAQITHFMRHALHSVQGNVRDEMTVFADFYLFSLSPYLRLYLY